MLTGTTAPFRVAGCTVNQTPIDWLGNRQRLLAGLNQAKESGAELVVFPELAITGYGCEDLFFGSDFLQRALHELKLFQKECAGITAIVGLPLAIGDRVYNAACVIQNTQILGFYAKQKLCGDGIHYEPRWFAAWPAGVYDHVKVDNHRYPIGELIYEIGDIKFAVEICEDAWVGQPPMGEYARRGADLVLNLSASHFSFGKSKRRAKMAAELSRRYHTAFLYVNLLGNEAGRIIFDGEVIFAQEGEVRQSNSRFSFADYNVTCFDFDLTPDTISRRRVVSNEPILGAETYTVIAGNTGRNKRNKELPALTLEPKANVLTKEEETLKAVSLGLFDYVRKSRSRGFVVSLSGGADSSLCAVFARKALDYAWQEYGPKLVEKMNLSEEAAKLAAKLTAGDTMPAELSRQLLFLAYQGSKNSSEATLNSAKELATELGGSFYNWTIDDEVASITNTIESNIGRSLSWDSDDIALQNIQARIRAPYIWMIANLTGGLLLSTSNRSEAAVGYATMDGDTAGGLSPIADLDKHYVRGFLRWAETNLGLASLRHVNELTPSAELRPGESQTDEEDLMPYELLKEIEHELVANLHSPKEIYNKLHSKWTGDKGMQDADFKAAVKKFFRLFAINQWKRERYAPSFHLDAYNLDPRSWFRFPILSGSFQAELEEL